MTTIGVIDHGAGNLVSIAQGLAASGADVRIVDDPSGLTPCDGLVLPGVGATAPAMGRLAAKGLVEPLRNWELPLLGICVGLQVFFETSDEDGARCLGIVPGAVRRLDNSQRLPHIGWNDVRITDDPLFVGIASGTSFYFVHTYAPQPADVGVVIGTTEYGTPFTAAIRSANRVGVQFHPERSGPAGLQVLANFVASCKEESRAA
ncbi:MAG: imidazole glycerol phosphate synthase subunit HisH [Acidimicrobiia bacterium]|nr:imidazole glycerol phosphate synthase subunit HisH [Acidimicrobiia bacterium]